MKTCRELGISKTVKDALIRVRDGLASGQYKHVESWSRPDPTAKRSFNMGTANLLRKTECGTLGCIGGWVAFELKSCDPESVANSGVMEPLCYPTIKGAQGFWDEITPAMAAKAITNVLRAGKPNWARVMKSAERN